MYGATVFFFIFGIIAAWAFSLLLYRHSHFGTLHNKQLPRWEMLLYYFIAAYPVASYLVLPAAGHLFEDAGTPRNMVLQYFTVYVAAHILLSVLSLTVVRFLLKRSRLNILFALTTSVAGGLYIAGGIVLMMR